MIPARLLRLCFCLTLIALPALALGRPSGQSGAVAPSNIDCIYLPMLGAGGQAAATITTAQSVDPCDGLAAAPEPSATSAATSTVTATSTTTGTATSTATAAHTSTSTATAIRSATATHTAAGTATALSSATATHTATGTATGLSSATATSTSTATSTATGSPTASATATIPAEPSLLSGTLRLRPEQPLTLNYTMPRRVIAVLDVSGSMSANFNGQCNNTGPIRQCANGPANFPAVQVTGTGVSHWWNPVEERRIYVAKQAIQRLIGQLNMPGNPGYDATRPPDELALVWFNHEQRTAMTTNWSSNPLSLTNSLLGAGRTNADDYRTNGGTNIPAGFYRASLLLNASPETVEFEGRLYPYDFSVVYISDGLANQFLDVTKPNLAGGGSDARTYAVGNACQTTANVAESAACMTTEVGGLHVTKGWDRPFTQAYKIAQTLHTTATVYVLTISALESSYQVPLASSPAQFYAVPSYSRDANGNTNLDLTIDQIVSMTQANSCLASVAPWVDSIDAAHSPDEPSLPPGTFGSLRLYNAQSELIGIAQVSSDGQGRLRYAFSEALPPGSYTLSGALYYKGDDGITRPYSRFEVSGPPTSALPVELLSGPQAIDLSLRVVDDVCAAQINP